MLRAARPTLSIDIIARAHSDAEVEHLTEVPVPTP